MNGFLLRTTDNKTIRFRFYHDEAALTCKTFEGLLPFSRTFFHARVSGEEIWIDNAPSIDIIQENASVFPQPGEIVIGPAKPARNKIVHCMGIFYGKGKLVDCGNIFGKVFDEDLALLRELGDAIWRSGAQEIEFAQFEES